MYLDSTQRDLYCWVFLSLAGRAVLLIIAIAVVVVCRSPVFYFGKEISELRESDRGYGASGRRYRALYDAPYHRRLYAPPLPKTAPAVRYFLLLHLQEHRLHWLGWGGGQMV